MCRQVACAQADEYNREIPGGSVDILDKTSADDARLYEGTRVGADRAAGFAERLAKVEDCRSKVEALPAKLDKGAANRRRGRQGTRQAMRQVDDKTDRQALTWPGRRPGRRVTTQTGR